MSFNVYLNGSPKRDAFLRAFAKGCQGLVHNTSSSHKGGISVTWGLDHESITRIKECRKLGRPFIFLDHSYFRRGYDNGNARVCVGGVHQNSLLGVCADRREKLGVEVQPWRRGREVVIIAPSEKVCEYLGVSKRWAFEVWEEIKQFTGRPIRIKKKGPGLLGELSDAHAVVSLASVAEVEAAKFGVPVFTSKHSPAAPIAEMDFSRIETPRYPEREPWLNSLAYSQFSLEEMANGTTTRVLKDLHGDFHLRGATNSG